MKNMYKLTTVGLAALGLALATPSSYAQQNYDYSYTFDASGNYLTVSGSFEGYLNEPGGNLVTGISDVTVFYTPSGGSTTEMTGTVDVDTYNGSSWVPGGVLSLDGTQNNFLFENNSETQNFAWEGGNAFANPGSLAPATTFSPVTLANWSLVDPPSVPDSGTTAMLCGISLVALGLFRRKL